MWVPGGNILSAGEELDLEEIVAVIDVLDGVDFLIVEGFKSMEYANFSTSTPNEFTLKVVDPFKLEDVDELIDLIKGEVTVCCRALTVESAVLSPAVNLQPPRSGAMLMKWTAGVSLKRPSSE